MCSFNEKWGNICMNAAVCGRSINMVCTSSLSHMRLELEGRQIGSNETTAVTSSYPGWIKVSTCGNYPHIVSHLNQISHLACV